MGRYDGEDYADESGYASSAMQDAVRRGLEPAEGYPGYPEERMYPVCERCTHRHGIKENCVGEVGEQDRLERNRQAAEARHEAEVVKAIELLKSKGFDILPPLPRHTIMS